MEGNRIKTQMFTNKELVSLSVPIVIESVLAITAGMADSTMVSSAGAAAVSGISLVDQIVILLVMFFTAIASGGVVVTAQYIGSENISKAKSSAKQLLYASTAMALLIVVGTVGFIPEILDLVYGELEPAVTESARVYFFYILLGMPFLAVASACTALLRTMSHSKLALFLALGANLLNVAGNAVLIYGFEMGAAGAAIATTFSRVVWAVVAMVIMHNRSLPVFFEGLLKFQIDWKTMGKVLQVGGANGLENGLFQFGKVLVARVVSDLGTVFIAANYVAGTLCNIGYTIVGSLSTVLLTVVGQCIGANETQQAKSYTKKFLLLGNVLVVILFGMVFLLRNQLVRMFDFDAQTLEICAHYTGMGALITMGGLYGFAFLPVSAFRSAGDVRYAVVLSVTTMFTFRVGLSYLLHYVFELGLISVWIGMGADWMCRAVCNFIHFRKGTWLTKKLI